MKVKVAKNKNNLRGKNVKSEKQERRSMARWLKKKRSWRLNLKIKLKGRKKIDNTRRLTVVDET
jgi:hypothetical protein